MDLNAIISDSKASLFLFHILMAVTMHSKLSTRHGKVSRAGTQKGCENNLDGIFVISVIAVWIALMAWPVALELLSRSKRTTFQDREELASAKPEEQRP